MITLDEVKRHTRIDDCMDDDVLDMHLQGAIKHCLHRLNRNVFFAQSEVDVAINNGDEYAMLFNQDLFTAVCFRFAQVVEYRTAEIPVESEKALTHMLNLYRIPPGV